MAQPKRMLVATAMLLFLAPGARAEIYLIPRDATSSELRNLVASGPYRSDRPAIPAGANPSDHQGRAAGTFEDSGRGVITGGIRGDANGNAILRVQDAGDGGATMAGTLRITTARGDVLVDPLSYQADGNVRTYRITGLFARAWNGIKVAWTQDSPKPGRQNGFSLGVCK